MSTCETNDNKLLQSLLHKITLYLFTRNFDKALKDRKISHAELSVFTRGSGNWFNRAFNELEDMRVATFINAYVAVSKILESRNKYDPIEISSVFNVELLQTESVSIDLSIIDDIDLLCSEEGLSDFFIGLKVHVEAMKKLRDVVTPQETKAYYKVLERLRNKGGIN